MNASASVAAVFAPRAEGPWLFGRAMDIALFGGSAALSMALLAYGAATGLLEGEAPGWVWVSTILAVDVAHVWSTAFRVYLDPSEVRRRPGLYLGLPAALYVAGVGLALISSHLFWQVLAYAAVFHFVRQQYGWVALYRRRGGETGAVDRVIDTGAIYAATVWPLIYWHAHLPRSFVWFVPDDFVPGLAEDVARLTEPVYWLLLVAFVLRQVQLALRGPRVNWGKVLVVATTWAAWWVGIVALDSDYAFTVTNVLIHGIPYIALTYRYGRARGETRRGTLLGRLAKGGIPVFLLCIVGAALFEEGLWDRLVWHDRPGLFGETAEVGDLGLALIVPLLALPQATHYALDAFIWRVRRGKNPTLADELKR